MRLCSVGAAIADVSSPKGGIARCRNSWLIERKSQWPGRKYDVTSFASGCHLRGRSGNPASRHWPLQRPWSNGTACHAAGERRARWRWNGCGRADRNRPIIFRSHEQQRVDRTHRVLECARNGRIVGIIIVAVERKVFGRYFHEFQARRRQLRERPCELAVDRLRSKASDEVSHFVAGHRIVRQAPRKPTRQSFPIGRIVANPTTATFTSKTHYWSGAGPTLSANANALLSTRVRSPELWLRRRASTFGLSDVLPLDSESPCNLLIQLEMKTARNSE
ncbi:hypothetical protein ACVW1C_002601 [Bradyrhizobium sp. USDA 4011]